MQRPTTAPAKVALGGGVGRQSGRPGSAAPRPAGSGEGGVERGVTGGGRAGGRGMTSPGPSPLGRTSSGGRSSRNGRTGPVRSRSRTASRPATAMTGRTRSSTGKRRSTGRKKKRGRRKKKPKPCPLIIKRGKKFKGKHVPPESEEQAARLANRDGAPCAICAQWLADRVALREQAASINRLETELSETKERAGQEKAAMRAAEAEVRSELVKEQHKSVSRRATLMRLQEQIEALERERDELVRDLGTADMLSKRAKKEYVALQVEQEHLWSKLAASREEARNLTGEVKNLKIHNATLERELKTAHAVIESADTKRVDIDQALQDSLAAIRELQAELEAEKAEKAALKAEYATQVKRIPQAFYSPARARVGLVKSLGEKSRELRRH
ncbi:uncharacterized protein AMSG_02707 [Thecamonas trahens ATCC 50062]|uniref:Uncharacterized protein n=1 Tax=Thecamonas trahens ATCC 50062 TaxID=461836 RepID=A0A0L0D4M1_THETB|nr:hypothetical protein AMSG_02707 [Thecamonas trahens ATCC 50062]KNC46253.1 hypothetical protein AMSG_02707 [Thecamonas trahens ATCC 50062]|eukprot:XP_013760547.1 hypothetical protein AMSG_02707 [Thecamonas trahens ATCC 50062]